MRRRARRGVPVLPLALVAVLVGLPAAAHTAGLQLPVPAISRTSLSPVNHDVARLGHQGGVLTAYTAMDVTVTAAVTPSRGQVRIRAKQPSGTETAWTPCSHSSGTTWRCTYATSLNHLLGEPALTAWAALP